jgi:hypothetical protein
MSRMCGSTFLPNTSSASISSSGCSEPRGLERQIDDAGADLFAALLQLREDLARPAAEVDRQRPVDIRRPPSGTAFGGGGYYFLDELDRAVIPTVNQQIWIVQVRKSRPYLEHVNTCDLSQLLGQQISGQSIQSVFPDAQGLLWFTTSGLPTPNTQNGPAKSPALVGTLVFKGTNQCAVNTLTLAPTTTPTNEPIYETISKSFAVDPVPAAKGQGGVFIVSDYAMYRFDAAADGTPQITWREEYDRGTSPPKLGQIQVGSGTTPTLMGTDFVTIADNANPIDVLVYRRAAQVQGSRLVCKVPVFETGASATENSLIATNQSIIVENNYGYYGPQATLFNRATTPGITRIDLNADQNGCNIVWTNNQNRYLLSCPRCRSRTVSSTPTPRMLIPAVPRGIAILLLGT